MKPPSSVNYAINGSVGDSEYLSYFCCTHSLGVKLDNFWNIFLFQFCIVILGTIEIYAKDFYSMLYIFNHRNAFYVIDSVILFVTIFMIELHSLFPRTAKRFKNYFVNFDRHRNAALTEMCSQISIGISRTQDPIAIFENSPNSSNVARFIKSLKSWYRFPIFHVSMVPKKVLRG